MESTLHQALPGGRAIRRAPAGVVAGAPLTRIDGPADALALVADELHAAEVALRELLHSDVAAVPAVAGYLVDAGGKRLRPALTALGARAIGYTGPVSELMCVGELIHLGSLLHDDVVDQGDERRGRAATHRVYGNAVTILTGDFCLARAVLLASEHGGHAAVTGLARAVTEMAEGEVIQLQRAGDLDCPLETYLDLVEKKSAALIAWCASAAALAHGEPFMAEALQAYGRAIGVAFQITDDVLDYSHGTGKPAGADLRERKVTLPLLYAMQVDPSLRDALQAGQPSHGELPALMARVRATGALDQALDYARSMVQGATERLDMLPAGSGRQALRVLGHYLVERAR